MYRASRARERTEEDTLKEAEVAARALGMRPQFVEGRGPENFGRAFSDMIRARADALAVLTSSIIAVQLAMPGKLVTPSTGTRVIFGA